MNSYEAESRRLSRFFTHGATQGNFQLQPEATNSEFAFTLDLRNR